MDLIIIPHHFYVNESPAFIIGNKFTLNQALDIHLPESFQYIEVRYFFLVLTQILYTPIQSQRFILHSLKYFAPIRISPLCALKPCFNNIIHYQHGRCSRQPAEIQALRT